MKIILALILTMACCIGSAQTTMAQTPTYNNEKTVELKIVETSDVHGHFFPYDFTEKKPLLGTLARVNTYVERERKQYGDRLLLMDNGDILQGQPVCYWSNFVKTDEENIAASIVNYMKYDVEAVGNHDIETGHEVYDKWIREVKCPIIGANIVDKQTGRPYVKPYTMLVRDGIKIAVIGLITPTISCWLNEETYKGIDFQEMVSCARKWIAYVKEAERPDVVIGLFHSGMEGGLTLPGGIEEDATKRVAQEVEGFDAIFFGHDHQVHNEWLSNPKGQKVLCLDPSCNGRNIAEAVIKVTYRDGRLVDKIIDGRIVDIRNEAVDQQFVDHFASQTDAIKAYTNQQIGVFKNSASTRDSYFGPSAFTDFIHNLQLQISGAEISFNAPLSFDSRINEGPVTVSDMFKLYRFENKLYIVEMTGREIRGHLEMSYDLWVNTMKHPDDHLLLLNERSVGDQQRMGFKNFTFNFDSACGIDYEVDVTKPDGKKVNILRMTNGQPFSEDKIYRVVMNSYRGNGGGDLLTHGAGIPKDQLNSRIVYQSSLDLRHYLMQEIKSMGTVAPTANSNWRFVPEEWTVPAAKRDRKLIFGD